MPENVRVRLQNDQDNDEDDDEGVEWIELGETGDDSGIILKEE